jgi:hypothetical protein
MNKYEKLMEYIINDQEDKAKALFHQIVVERSREIYESLMDEQDPAVQDDQVEGLVDEITADETCMHEADDDMEMDIDPEASSRMGDMGSDMEMGMGDEEGEEGGEGEIEDRVMDLEDAIDELKAEFDRIIGGDEQGSDDAEVGDDEGSEELNMNEAKDEDEAEDKEGDDDKDEDKKDVKEAKSAAEKLREYVDKVSDGHGPEKKGGAEGSEVGKAGSSVGVNKQSIVAGKNDMGGTTANITKGGTESAPDGQAPKGAVKGKGEFTGQFQNKPGAKADMGKAPAAKKGEDGGIKKTSIEPGSK